MRIRPADPAESSVARKILSRIRNRDANFVFPTQVAADSWARAVADMPGVLALEKDRFLGWDRLMEKSRQARAPAGKAEVDSAARLLWSVAAMKDPPSGERLAALLPDRYPASMKTGAAIARFAPRLKELEGQLLTMAASGAPEAAIARDYLALSAEYSGFLDAHGLFEPRHVAPDFSGSGGLTVFGADLIPDFAALGSGLAAMANIELFAISDCRQLRGEARVLRRYGTFAEELEDVMCLCGRFMDDGLKPDRIAISVPRITPSLKAHLERAARRHDVPIFFRGGEPLAASPFGKLLASIQEAARGMSIRSLRRLADSPPFRWSSCREMSSLIAFGEKYCIPEISSDSAYVRTLWHRSLTMCDSGGAALSLFQGRLESAIDAAARSKTFGALRQSLYAFREDFLDEGALPHTASATLERVFSELEALETASSALSLAEVGNPLQLLLMRLEETRYSPVASEDAIAISPYGLGALSPASIHFVLDLSHDAVSEALPGRTGLPGELAAMIEGASCREETLIDAFDVIGACFCHAELGLSGFSVPHPAVSSSTGAEILRISAPDIGAAAEDTEAEAWQKAEPASLPSTLPANLRDAARGIFLLPAIGGDSLAEASECPPPVLAAQAFEASSVFPADLRRGTHGYEGLLPKFSPGKLREFLDCPFKWLASTLCPESEGGGKAAVFAEGQLTHELIRAVLESGPEGILSPQDAAAMAESGRRLFRSCLAATLRRFGPALEAELLPVADRLYDRIGRYLDFERGFRAQGWDRGRFEAELFAEFPEVGIALGGRADRICARAEAGDRRVAIIDYKKNRTPTKRDFLSRAGKAPRDLQLACYSAILEREDSEVVRAFYWSVESNAASDFIGAEGSDGSGLPETERVPLEAAFRAAAADAAAGLLAEVRPSREACDACPSRPICRAHYSTERLQ